MTETVSSKGASGNGAAGCAFLVGFGLLLVAALIVGDVAYGQQGELIALAGWCAILGITLVAMAVAS